MGFANSIIVQDEGGNFCLVIAEPQADGA